VYSLHPPPANHHSSGDAAARAIQSRRSPLVVAISPLAAQYHLTHDRHTAEDLAQETFLKAFAGLRKFQAGTNFGAWLFRIAHNNYANQCRAAARPREPLPDELADRRDGPLEQIASAEALQALGRAINRLPAEFRSALLLRVDEGLSFREIADVLDLTEETARWRVFKARQKLLGVLAPRQEQEKS
jgi:RNA polymerase sigma-70 factor (ECF subfamily)